MEIIPQTTSLEPIFVMTYRIMRSEREKKFENSKWATRSHKSKKDRQYNDKGTNSESTFKQYIVKHRATRTPLKTGGELRSSRRSTKQFLIHMLQPWYYCGSKPGHKSSVRETGHSEKNSIECYILTCSYDDHAITLCH